MSIFAVKLKTLTSPRHPEKHSNEGSFMVPGSNGVAQGLSPGKGYMGVRVSHLIDPSN